MPCNFARLGGKSPISCGVYHSSHSYKDTHCVYECFSMLQQVIWLAQYSDHLFPFKIFMTEFCRTEQDFYI